MKCPRRPPLFDSSMSRRVVRAKATRITALSLGRGHWRKAVSSKRARASDEARLAVGVVEVAELVDEARGHRARHAGRVGGGVRSVVGAVRGRGLLEELFDLARKAERAGNWRLFFFARVNDART